MPALPENACFQCLLVRRSKREELSPKFSNLAERAYCRLPVERDAFLVVVRANRFESWTGGRKRGQEDVKSHERKGIAGDWANHFSPRVAAAFRSRYGSLLVATGYEKDERW